MNLTVVFHNAEELEEFRNRLQNVLYQTTIGFKLASGSKLSNTEANIAHFMKKL